MLSTGVDIIEIDRVRQVLERYGLRFLQRVFTPGEIAYCRNRAPNLAARFAAKEATMKALGTGVRGVSWRDIEVVRAASGAPGLLLHGRCLARAQRLGVSETSLSMSHSREYAVAFVVVQQSGPAAPAASPPGGAASSNTPSGSGLFGNAPSGDTPPGSALSGDAASGNTPSGGN